MPMLMFSLGLTNPSDSIKQPIALAHRPRPMLMTRPRARSRPRARLR